jgi:hypothetical protein
MKTLHAANLEKLLKKVTLDNLIQFCQLNFVEGRIKSSIIAITRDVVVQHDLVNNVLGNLGEGDDITFNFTDPQLRVTPQLKALGSIDIEEADIEMSDEKIKILAGQWGGGTIHFCDDSVLENHIMLRNPRELDYFHTINVTPDMHFGFKPIKMIAPQYGKIYFTVTDGNLVLETGDKTNRFTDNYKLPLAGELPINNLTVCFDFNHFNCLMNVMAAEEEKQYKMKFAWNEEDERGMLYAHTLETGLPPVIDEKYFLFSRAN